MKFQRGTILFWAPEPWVGVKFDYDPAMVTCFKAVPRAWDAVQKTWWIAGTHAPLVSTALQAFGDVTDRTTFGSFFRGNPYACLGVMANAPKRLVIAARDIAVENAKEERDLIAIASAFSMIEAERSQLGTWS